MQLTLALPALTWAHDTPPLPPVHAPALWRLLHWGRVQGYTWPRSRFYAHYLWHGSLWPRDGQRLPENNTAFWCSPLHQQIGLHHIQAAHGAVLAIQPAEALQWCADLSAFFATDGWQFQVWRPDVWRVTAPPLPPWESACILDLPPLLDENSRPYGAGSARLLQAQTEIQMLLHTHPLNRHRNLPVNAVWFWQDVPGNADPGQTLYSDSPWAAQTRPRPASFDAWQRQATAAEAAVVFAEDFTAAGDADARAALLRDWETHWFAPVLAALRSGNLKHLCIADEQGCLKTSKPKLTPFWRSTPVFQGIWP